MDEQRHTALNKIPASGVQEHTKKVTWQRTKLVLSQCKVGSTSTQLSKHNKAHRVEHRSYIVITREKAFDEVQQPLPDQSPEEPRKTRTDALMYGPPVTATEPAACQTGKEVSFTHLVWDPCAPSLPLPKWAPQILAAQHSYINKSQELTMSLCVDMILESEEC